MGRVKAVCGGYCLHAYHRCCSWRYVFPQRFHALISLLRSLVNDVRADIRKGKVHFASSDLLERQVGPLAKQYEICEVETVDGSALTAYAPQYQVETTKYKHVADDYRAKIVNFGGKVGHDVVRGDSTPFNNQAPELIFWLQALAERRYLELRMPGMKPSHLHSEAQLTSSKGSRVGTFGAPVRCRPL